MKKTIVLFLTMVMFFGCKTPKNKSISDIESYKKLIALYKKDSTLLDNKNKEFQLVYDEKEASKAKAFELENELEFQKQTYENEIKELKNAPVSSPLIKGETIEKIKVVNSVIYKDSSKIIYPNTNASKVAFYCPNEMKEETTYEVSAILGYLIEDKQIRTELLNAVNESRIERAETPLTINDIVAKNVSIGHYVKIKLVDPGKKFDIMVLENYPHQDSLVKVYDEQLQTFNNGTFTWKWLVTPKAKTSGAATLVVLVTPFNKQMQAQVGKERNFTIKIKLKKTFTQKLIDHATEFPEWTYGSIIAPIISFFVGMYMEGRKRNQRKALPENGIVIELK